MRSLIKNIVANAPAFNVLMFAIIGLGIFCFFRLRSETFPNFELEMVTVSVAYPGATPEEVERGICQKIEEAVRSVDGVKKITSRASEGVGSVMIELKSSVDNVDRKLNEIRNMVDRIPSFPVECENPDVLRATFQETIIMVGILGPELKSLEDELRHRELAEQLRDEILLLPQISQVNLVGTKSYEIDIEIPEDTLRQHGLSLASVADAVRRENCLMPGGTIQAKSQEIMVRVDNRRYTGPEIAELPVITQADGAVLKVKDLGTVHDAFADVTATTLVDGQPAVVLTVMRNTSEDIMQMIDQVRDCLDRHELPPGYSLVTWGDRSSEIRDRLALLYTNGLQGLLIVLIILSLFLDLRLAFWVALGIPFSICVTSIYLFSGDLTLNMISTFGFIMALGIVVDDAIVVGENISTHREMGKDYLRAAIDGTAEVIPSVTASVLTTIVAFLPMLFISGIMGKIIAVLPVAVIAMLVASLFECFTILPCHLAHKRSVLFGVMNVVLYIFRPILWAFKWLNRHATAGMAWVIENFYSPTMDLCLKNRSVFVAGCVSLLILSGGLLASGIMPFVIMGKIDTAQLQASLSFPAGTPPTVTDRWTIHIEEAFWKTAKEYEDAGTPIALRSFRTVGTSIVSHGRNIGGGMGGGSSHKGTVQGELIPSEERTISSTEFVNRWREHVGVIPGVESISVGTGRHGPGGVPIEFKLTSRAEDADQLEEAVRQCREYMAGYEGVFDISDNNIPGKWEFKMGVQEDAAQMGVRHQEIAQTMRHAYYGNEVMRLQRGRHEVKLMVRYPREERHTLANFHEIRIRGNDGTSQPISEVADIKVERGYSTIHRVDQRRSVTVSADVDDDVANSREIVTNMKTDLMPRLQKELPGVGVRWEGRQERTDESVGSLMIGFVAAMMLMFVILAFEFKSFLQPLLVILIIPFGAVGAIAGHLIMGIPLMLFSLFGLVALCGVVINDSIVMIDFINHRIREGVPAHDAVRSAGARRFRPVVLTSLTTMGGLMPILLERSLQAQMLIPMVTSIGFGVFFAMLWVLYLAPISYSIYADALQHFGYPLPAEVQREMDLMDQLPIAEGVTEEPLPQQGT